MGKSNKDPNGGLTWLYISCYLTYKEYIKFNIAKYVLFSCCGHLEGKNPWRRSCTQGVKGQLWTSEPQRHAPLPSAA